MVAFGLYTHIQANRRRSVALVIGLFVLVYVLTFAFALLFRALELGPPTPGGAVQDYLRAAARDLLWLSPIVTAATALWVWVASRFHQGLIDAVTGSEGVARETDPRLYNLLENLCISRGVPMPRLKIMDSDRLNAFATGLNEKQYAITVTRGLLAALDDARVEQLGFEGQARRAFVAILIALALIALAWALSLVIRFALSRSREYLADAGSVELTKNPDAMISALMKISGKGELEGVPSGLMEMCVDNPRSGFADLFATHPPIEERIDALVRYAGGHRPPPQPQAPTIEAPAPPSPWGPPAAA